MSDRVSDEAYECLRAAVNIARFRQVICHEALTQQLLDRGYSEDVIRDAYAEWGRYERATDV